MSNQLFRPAAASVLRRLFASASAVSDGSSPQAAHASAARGLGGCWRQLAPALQHNAQRLGLQQPTAVQEQAFRPIRSGLPTTLAAVTGTGKTLAFLLPLLDRAMALEMLRPFYAVLLSPSRELALQTYALTKSLLQNIPEQKSGRLVHLLASGMESESKTFARLRREQPSIIVGTPKCVLAALDQCHFADEVGAVVLDEVDELLAVKRAVLDRRSRHGRPAISVVDRIVFKREFHVDEDRSMAVLQRRPNVQIISVSASHGIGTNSELNRLNYADRYVRVHLLPHGVRSMPATLTHTVIGPHADIALGPQREEFRLKRAAQRQQHLEQVSKSLSSAVAATSLPPDLFPQRITDRDGINGIIEQAMPLMQQALTKLQAAAALVFVPTDVRMTDALDVVQNAYRQRLGSASQPRAQLLFEHVQGLGANAALKKRQQMIDFVRSGTVDNPALLLISMGATRGLDLPEMDVAVLLAPPRTQNDYLHIAGRVGRQGRKGTVVTLLPNLHQTERFERICRQLDLEPSVMATAEKS